MSRLAELTAKLREQTNEASREIPTSTVATTAPGGSILFLGTPDDKEYIHLLSGMFGSFSVSVICTEIGYLTQLDAFLKKTETKRIVSTSPSLLKKLVASLQTTDSESSSPKIDDYAGSVFDYKGAEILFIDPLSHLFSVPYGKFITKRFVSKLTEPECWSEATEFKWDVLVPSNIAGYYQILSQAYAIAVDIETVKGPRPTDVYIRCISFTGLFTDDGAGLSTLSLVLPITDHWAIIWMRKFCDLPVQKILQRGKYDNSYLLRYSCPVRNWLWDTANCLHCWYAELPKDLGFQNAFFLRKVVYWKDLSETKDLHEYYRYNALDGWATANVWAEWMLQAPSWAKRNYVIEFPINFGCLLCEMTGIERDIPKMHEVRIAFDEKEKKLQARLNAIVGTNLNVNSHVQIKQVMRILGDPDPTSSDKKALARAKLKHPICNLIFTLVEDIRELRKRRSTYLRLDSDREKASDKGAKEFLGRILYALLTDGTDTGRLASREHHFWCGLQIQNIESGEEVKQTIKASLDFYLGESDLEQAESRDTGYISGDTGLINAVESPRDFHSVNCSAFFGVPYDDIFDDETRKPKNKKLRDLSKRTNHGFNYNMGEWMLIETMGLDKIWEAGRLLRLPTTDPRTISQYLLSCADRTYPGIKGEYYPAVIREIIETSMLTSRAYLHTEYNLSHFEATDYINRGDWVRYCFGRPDKSKIALNSYVAHAPQHLNSRTLNEAFMRVFYEVALPNPGTFRLHAQIHDSILFSYHPSRPDHAEAVRHCMEIPITIRDVSGITRKFTVPAALKIGKVDKKTGELKRAIYWSETE